MNMNSFEGKRILALIRDGDYAHAGEEEAIERALRSVAKDPRSWMLDVWMRSWRSAEYLRRHGWKARRESIATTIRLSTQRQLIARSSSYLRCADGPATVAREFDVIYMSTRSMRSRDQRGALAALRKVAKHGARLVIFDYGDRRSPNETDLSVEDRFLFLIRSS